MTIERAKLYFMCGKMAAGKSTCAIGLARTHDALLVVQDTWLETLYPGEIRQIADYVEYSARLRAALLPHLRDVLSRGISIVLDFPANTIVQRRWFRGIVEGTGVAHELHFVDAADDVCKRQLRQRSAGVPLGTPWTTDAEFDAITAYFQAPTADEGFVVVRHERA